MAKLVGHAMAVVGQDLTAIDGPSTVATANGLGQRNPVGSQSFDDAGNVYIYLAGVASLAANDWVLFGQGATAVLAFAGVRLLNDAGSAVMGSVAVAQAAAVAGTWGWFQIYGLVAAANIATTSSVNFALYRTGTAGRASVTQVAKDCIFGAMTVGASVANVGAAWINYPFVTDNSTL